jgi:Thiolase, C-terminal domain
VSVAYYWFRVSFVAASCVLVIVLVTVVHFVIRKAKQISILFALLATGARILAHLAHEFHQEGCQAKLSIGSACIGGGQGIAVLLEKAQR